MELWIRSQDKECLLKVEYLCVDYDTNIRTGTGLILGTYKTKERAREILDKIQEIIKPQLLFKEGKILGSIQEKIVREPAGCEIKELSAYVYEMPKE